MAQEKYLVVSDFRDRQVIHHKGETIELDLADKEEAIKVSLLNHAGRIGLNTPDNVKAIQAEIRRDKEREEKRERDEMLARQAMQNQRSPQPARATA